ncbi:tetratricopeptide repeat protein, partial [Alphaproteobacteria bacterium]|nr:tetratricopeptide repeat protein [Alphaproteobacteria bacterium]
ILSVFPKNNRAQKALTNLLTNNTSYRNTNLPQDITNKLVNLYNKKKFTTLISEAEFYTKQYPNSSVVWNILGVSCNALGKYPEAVEAFEKVNKLSPNQADGYNNLGISFQGNYNFSQAIDAYHQAISINPQYFNAYYNLGHVLQLQNKYAEALKSYKKAILLKPDYVEAYNNIGLIFQELNKFEESMDSFKKAISIRSNYPEAYNNMGLALQKQNKFIEALEFYRHAITLKPNYAEAFNNLGLAFQGQGNLNKAAENYNKALSLNINYGDAYYNLGNVFKDLSKREDALKNYKKAILLNPRNQLARTQKLHQQAHVCDWVSIEEDQNLIPDLGITDQYIDPFTLISLEDAPRRHKLRGEIFSKIKFQKNILPTIIHPKHKPDRIRVGYFSADFCEHPVAYLIARTLELHDRNKFEIYAYSYTEKKNDKMHKRIMEAVDFFEDVSNLNDKQVALRARQDKIDIAIDLTGYTTNSRTGIFSYRPSPIQINYLGYPGSLGTNFIDYIIGDKNLIPKYSEKNFTEKIIKLPNSYMATDNTRIISKTKMYRHQLGLPDDAFVFCCFNNNYKITSVEFDIWMRLLSRVNKSVLWLRRSNEWSEENFLNEAKKRNIDTFRIIFADRIDMDQHLARHKHADLFLDTFNFNAHTTATEALWSGLPLITKSGEGFASRVAGSLLKCLDLDELVTTSSKDYEDLIFELATNPRKLRILKQKLKLNINSKPLFNSELFTKHLEKGYSLVYQRYFQGNLPGTINVPNN